MKTFLTIIILIAMNSSFASAASAYRLDDVDAIFINGKLVSVEDLRDGFTAVDGVQVNDETVSTNSGSKALILLRNPQGNGLLYSTIMGAKIGGDGGGG